ncbi:hypothetical protein H9Q72_004086 [Fusarium xylarioides]|uniref:AAA+ ATPase domain-containing protein n=1 Tax=Fusarium xylarioides TaxID=221167 RepID=A0A9P7LBQ4_9HYPO|nr:hypothetical protein H9Q72_004086 [Fusarium xylarioides]
MLSVSPAGDKSRTTVLDIDETLDTIETGNGLIKPQNESSEAKSALASDSTPAETNASLPGTNSPASEVESADPIDWKSRILGLPLLVSIGEFDFEDFKNRWGEDSRYHVVELLIGSDSTAEEKRREEMQQDGKTGQLGQRQEPKTKSSKSEQWIQRIRIHSPFVLNVLKDGMSPPDWSCEQPRVFFPPFKGLIHYHDYAKQRLEDLERRYGHTGQESIKNVDKDDDKSVENTARVELDHLRCYVDFMDERIMPMRNMFDGTDRRMVYFHELWHLFKVGGILYAPTSVPFKASFGLRTAKGRYHTSFKLYFKGVSVIDDSKPDDLNILDRTMTLWCYYLEYNGESYGPVKQRIIITAFSGKRDIRDLPAYPIRFAANAEKMQNDLMEQGKRFRRFTKEKHVSCDGWTITGPPLGVFDQEGNETPEHVEGDVIIDFQETLRRQPSWKPEFEPPSDEAIDDWKHGLDTMKINHWPTIQEPGKQKEPLFSSQELTQRDDDVEEKIKTAGVLNDALLQAYKEGHASTLDDLDEEVNNLLLPRRFFVYVLRQRRFAMVDIYSLEVIPPQSTIFDDLQIDMNHKLIVQSLVAAHFEKQKAQRHRPVLGPVNQDLVRGKGSGLFILLHGVPGVGKTATAEAVAQANNKPLFTITCGDLGLTPEAVDSKLNEVFRLAHLWDCVLLLDEADVFLARRDTYNLQRNALVSVFLRVLEYYSGILFLTTNRVGILDEAFKSRIHISLYYEPLSRQQTVEIFRVNIKRLRGIEDEKQRQLKGTELEQPRLRIMAKSIIEYAQDYYDEHEDTPHLRWNGRQIRNAFQIASSLAHYNIGKASLGREDLHSGQVASPVLDERHFENVAVAIEQFGNYMDYTKAMTDADHARLEAIRADHMRNEDLAPRRREQIRTQDLAAYQYRNPSALRDEPPLDSMAGNTRRDQRRGMKSHMPAARATRHRESGQPEAASKNLIARAQAGSQGGPTPRAALQPQQRRPRYNPNDVYEGEDEYMEGRDFGMPNKESSSRVGVDSFEEDYDETDEQVDGGAQMDSMQSAELDYNE